MEQDTAVAVAKKSDLGLIHALETKIFAEHGYPYFFLRQAYDCWSTGLLVMKQDEELLGYLLKVPSSTNAEDVWILSLAVSAAARGKGVAKSLLKRAIEDSHCCRRVLLTVCPNNKPALALYQSFGFCIIDSEDDYFDLGEPRLILAYSGIIC